MDVYSYGEKVKHPPIVIGKLYKYNSYGALYSTDPTNIRYNVIIGEMSHGDMFVPLEAKQDLVMTVAGVNHAIPSKVFRILTATGMIGWVYMQQNYAVEAEG